MLFLFVACLISNNATAQCSICTKTAQQLGHKPAKALNAGIIYLMIAPLGIIAVVGYRWWKSGVQSGDNNGSV